MRNKKYNPRRLSQTKARTKTQNNVMVFVQGIPKTLTYNRQTKIISHIIDRQFHDEIVNAKHKWHITMAVLQLNHFGSQEIVWYEMEVDSAVYQHDLADYLTETHGKILHDEECKGKTFLRFAWVACPTGIALTDDEMYNIFKRLRGFQEYIFEQKKD